MWRFVFLLVFSAMSLLVFVGLGDQIYLSNELLTADRILIADSFYEEEGDDEAVPRMFQVWPGDNGLRSSDWFTECIQANPGDVIVLAPGLYRSDLWVFTPQLTITSQGATDGCAEIWGTIQIEADGVILDRIAITGPRKAGSSGHGVEIDREVVDRVLIRSCRIEKNEWTGVHLIGPRGRINKLEIQGCRLLENGMDGMDATCVDKLIISGCTIANNGRNFRHGVGVRIGSYVQHVAMQDNRIFGNRFADVYRRQP